VRLNLRLAAQVMFWFIILCCLLRSEAGHFFVGVAGFFYAFAKIATPETSVAGINGVTTDVTPFPFICEVFAGMWRYTSRQTQTPILCEAKSRRTFPLLFAPSHHIS